MLNPLSIKALPQDFSSDGAPSTAFSSPSSNPLEAYAGSFLERAFDPKLVFPMMAGTVAFPLGRSLSLRLLGHNRVSSHALAYTLGFASEVTAFTGTQSFFLPPQRPSVISRWVENAKVLGVLKGFHQMGRVLSQGASPGLQEAVKHTAAYGGLLSIYGLEGKENAWAYALGDYLGLSLGASLGGMGLGPNIKFRLANLQYSLRRESSLESSQSLGSALALAPVGGRIFSIKPWAFSKPSRPLMEGTLTLEGLGDVLSQSSQLRAFLEKVWRQSGSEVDLPRDTDLVLWGDGGKDLVKELQLNTIEDFNRLGVQFKGGDRFYLFMRPVDRDFWVYKKKGNHSFPLAVAWFEGRFGKIGHPAVRALLGYYWGRNSRDRSQGARVKLTDFDAYLEDPGKLGGISLEALWRYQARLNPALPLHAPKVLYFMGIRNGHTGSINGLRLVGAEVAQRAQGIGEKSAKAGYFLIPIVREGAEHEVWRGYPIEQWVHRYERSKNLGRDPKLGDYRRIPKKKPPQITRATFEEILANEAVREEFLNFLWTTQRRTPWPPSGNILFLGQVTKGQAGRLRLFPAEKKEIKKGGDDFEIEMFAAPNKGEGVRLKSAKGPGSYELAWAWLRNLIGPKPSHAISHRLLATLIGTRYNPPGRSISSTDLSHYLNHLNEGPRSELSQYFLALHYFNPLRASQLLREKTLFLTYKVDRGKEDWDYFPIQSLRIMTPQEFKENGGKNGSRPQKIVLVKVKGRLVPEDFSLE